MNALFIFVTFVAADKRPAARARVHRRAPCTACCVVQASRTHVAAVWAEFGPFPGQIAYHQAVKGCLQPRADGEERQQGRPAALTGDTGRYGPEWPSGNPGRTERIAPPRGRPACSSARRRSASPLLSPARSRPGSPRSAMTPTRRRYRPPGSRARGWRPFGNRVPASTLAGRD